MKFDIDEYLRVMNISYMSRAKDIKTISTEFKDTILEKLDEVFLREFLKDGSDYLKYTNNFSIIEEIKASVPLNAITSTTSSSYASRTFKNLIEEKITKSASTFREFISNYQNILNEAFLGETPSILYSINNEKGDKEYIIEDGNSRIIFAKILSKFSEKKTLLLREASITSVTINYDLLKSIEQGKEKANALNCSLQLVKQTFQKDNKKCKVIKSVNILDSKGNIIDSFEPVYQFINGIDPVLVSFTERTVIKYCEKIEETIRYHKMLKMAQTIGLLSLVFVGSIACVF